MCDIFDTLLYINAFITLHFVRSNNVNGFVKKIKLLDVIVLNSDQSTNL